MYHKDIDYVVENNEIVIIDEFSGRKMPGRRWSEGLHQSVEAKESVKIQNENLTYASITFQNYFRLFDKLSGMTGTADTEATEFQQIYGLEVIVIPSHKKMIRKDHVDLVFLNVKDKYEAIIKDIITIHATKQPVLVGTTSIESSEYISKLLKVKKIKHYVLNAKQHQKEAEIISQAGKLSAVTIATNMAGRGTDIVLGGKDMKNDGLSSSLDNPDDVKKIGGLHIIGTERHESRRVDNQLRGRSGRQGDPGESRFYLSLEDNLMRIFASDKVTEIMKKLGMEDGEAIEHKWVSSSIENAQKRVEAYNFDIRKTLLEYDDIANEQRKVIYNQRNDILSADDLSSIYNNILSFTCEDLINNYIPLDIPSSQWDYDAINEQFKSDFSIEVKSSEIIKNGDHEGRVTFKNYIRNIIFNSIESNLDILSKEDRNELIRNIFLSVIDEDWRNHLNAMDYLRQGIGLRSYAQKNPKNEYKRESFEMFEEMLSVNNLETIKILTKIKVNNSNASDKLIKDKALNVNINKNNTDISRNALCPCGSGKKYKRCCGRL
jgi:preprotein translocase subunit SecA